MAPRQNRLFLFEFKKQIVKVIPMVLSRRELLAAGGAVIGAKLLNRYGLAAENSASAKVRSFHLSISEEALEADPELLTIVRDAGVTDLWITGFLYGHWVYSLETIQTWRKKTEAAGMAAHVIDVPFGHPGDALGSKIGNIPITPPTHWKLAQRPDGTTYAGTSLHPPATQENADALRKIATLGAKRVFLDDDFRLSQGPGIIGGCFCPEHKKAFLERTGYGETQWKELLDAVAQRNLTPVMRAWADFNCDLLTACFRAQQAAVPDIQLGNMVMYFGAEKAGIRLADYAQAPFRVGEMMFNDDDFTPVKRKMDELFSSLFHRRYAKPDLAFSETTAYPAHRLSAANMAAKLVVSTICDVRNTMYMSGATAFPRTHWAVLAPAMRRNAALHQKLAGHALRGPFKHYWGEGSRYVGDDNPFSLFLASGIPFEVTDQPARDGWTFLADADARLAFGGTLTSRGTVFVSRQPAANSSVGVRTMQESLTDLMAFKREMVGKLHDVPYIEEESPAVCAWYPTARSVLVWNLSEQKKTLTVRLGDTRRPVVVEALGVDLVENLA